MLTTRRGFVPPLNTIISPTTKSDKNVVEVPVITLVEVASTVPLIFTVVRAEPVRTISTFSSEKSVLSEKPKNEPPSVKLIVVVPLFAREASIEAL